MRPLLLSDPRTGEPTEWQNIAELSLPLPKPSGVRGLAAEGLGWDNARDNMRGWGVGDHASQKSAPRVFPAVWPRWSDRSWGRDHINYVETVSY